jgi:hypothetical protein
VTDKQLKMAAHLLDMASDKFSNHGCNDFDLRQFGFTAEEMREMVVEFNVWNGTPEEAEEVTDARLPWAMPDWLALIWLRRKILAACGRKESAPSSIKPLDNVPGITTIGECPTKT